MEKIHQSYFPLFLSVCRQGDFTPTIKQMIEDFVVGRIGAQKGARAFVFQQLYDLAGGKENIDYLLAAIELHLASMYCFNVAADAKAGYDTPDKKATAYKTQDVVYDLSLKAIDEFSASQKIRSLIKKIFAKTQQQFLEGEIIDTIVNLYENRGKLPEDISEKIENIPDNEIYNTYGIPKETILGAIENLPTGCISDFTYLRSYLVNAVMIENFGAIIGVLLDLDNMVIEKLKKYGKFYGVGMMIVNDVQDYSLDLIEDGKTTATREKNKSDVFNDIQQ